MLPMERVKNPKPKINIIERPIVFNPGMKLNNQIFEQVRDPNGNMKYLFVPSQTPKLKVASAKVVNGDDDVEYRPLERPAWSIVNDPEDVETWKEWPEEKELWSLTHQFLFDHIDLPEMEQYDILTAYIFASWIPEMWSTIPYLFFSGPKDSGKTRGLNLLRLLCYRGLLSPTSSPALMYRICDKHHPTLLLDETEIYGAEDKKEIVAVLNAGYKRGSYALRCTDKGDDYKAFDVFGFKVLAGTRKMRDTTESRCLVIKMMRNVRKVRKIVDEKRADKIRCKLLMYRFKKLLDGFDGFDGFSEGVPPELDFLDGRMFELFHCLYVVSNDGRENILSYARKELENKQNLEETSIEAEVLQCIVNYSSSVKNGFISTKQIAKMFNLDRDKQEKWKTQRVGSIIRRLGFKNKRGLDGSRGWKHDRKRLTYLMNRYNITPSPLENPTNPTNPTKGLIY